MNALVVQPPFTQLNTPYPAVYYLEAFLRERGIEARAVDHSIELYRSIFSREGIVPAFDAARRMLDRGSSPGAAAVDPASLSQLERYLSYEGLYLEWIDSLVAFLSGGDPALAHRLAQAVELPRGMRAEAFLEARGGRIASHEARGLATALLEDLGDLVSFAFDPSFETVRYGERIATSAAHFAPIRAALDASPLLGSAYAALLAAEWEKSGKAPELLLLSLPFPGCLLGALACARSAREAFGTGIRILFGGGYVSTELRGLVDGGIFDFCDYLCFDAGYGSLDSILEVEAGAPRERLYKTMYRDGDGRVVAAGFSASDDAVAELGSRRGTGCDQADRLRAAEKEALAAIAPDYAGCSFGRYLQFVDSENPDAPPMVRLALAQIPIGPRLLLAPLFLLRHPPRVRFALRPGRDRQPRRRGRFGIRADGLVRHPLRGRGHAHAEPPGLRPREPAPSRGRQKALSLLGQCPLRFYLDPR